MSAIIVMCTVRSIGEASRKSSKPEAWNSFNAVAEKSNETRLGKLRGVREVDHVVFEWKRSTLRFMALLKRGCEGGWLSWKPSKARSLGLTSENFWMFCQSPPKKSRRLIFPEQVESGSIVLTGTMLSMNTSSADLSRVRGEFSRRPDPWRGIVQTTTQHDVGRSCANGGTRNLRGDGDCGGGGRDG